LGSRTRHGQRSLSRIHRYRHAPRAVSRLRREPVALQSRRHGEGGGRRSCLSCERRCTLGNGPKFASRRWGGLRSLVRALQFLNCCR
jgi:hypothetical protein